MSDHSRHGRAVRARRGKLVEVRSLQEIRATLDSEDGLDGLPFMREMVRYCGRRFRIHRRAERVCIEGEHLRSMKDTVLLEQTRCDGASHDGCQRGCLMLWKTAWLKPAPSAAPEADAAPPAPPADEPSLAPTRNGRFYCQFTELGKATSPLSKWDLSGLVRDIVYGESSPSRVAYVLWCTARRKLPRLLSRAPSGRSARSPRAEIGLKPGEWVEVKSRDEIEATLTFEGKNRGLAFEMEMLFYCGRRYPVAYPLTKIISQQTGEMIQLTGTVVLEGVTCQGTCARNCPRANPIYWREIWLKRVHPEGLEEPHLPPRPIGEADARAGEAS